MKTRNPMQIVALVAALGLANLANQHAKAQLHPVDAEEATHIAREHLAGKVVKVARARDLGVAYFEVEIRADSSGLLYDVHVAADNGRVLRILLHD